MIKLEPGNVLLKPSQRRQTLTFLRRSIRLGERLGHLSLTISMRRSGRIYEMHAQVRSRANQFGCRARRHDWQSALRELTGEITRQLHDQRLGRYAVG